MRRRARHQESEELEPVEIIGLPTTPFKAIQLRILMKAREKLMSDLVKVDWEIWTLEEYFRVGAN